MLSNRFGESIRQRNTGVKGEECDGTLREVDSAYAESNKVVPQAYNLSLMRGQVFFLETISADKQRHFN